MEHYSRTIGEFYASTTSIAISRHEFYVDESSRMAITFPQWLKYENLSELENLNDRQRTSLVNLLSHKKVSC